MTIVTKNLMQKATLSPAGILFNIILAILFSLLTHSISQLAFTCSRSTIQTLEQRVKYGVYIFNFEDISYLILVLLLLTLSR